MTHHLFLVGFMGAGKSSVGRKVAEHLGMRFVDLDERITAESGATVSEIFETGGEEMFRDIERDTLIALQDEPPSVVACGGGVILRNENRRVLKRLGTVVYLKVSAAEALARIGDTSTRPLLSGKGGATAAMALLAARESLYEAVADVVVDTTGRGIDEVAAAVLEEVSGRLN